MAAASGSGGGIKELHEKLAPSARAVVGSSVARCGKAACAGGTAVADLLRSQGLGPGPWVRSNIDSWAAPCLPEQRSNT